MKIIPEVVGLPTHPLVCLRDIALAWSEYKRVSEEEQTKRCAIEAWEKATVAKIETQRDALMEYLPNSFDERAENFQVLFMLVDQAIANGNTEQLALMLNAITRIAEDSPLDKAIAIASLQSNLSNPEHEWEF